MKIKLLLAVALSQILFACADSPKGAAEKLAKSHVEAIDKHYSDLAQIYRDFIDKFSSTNYKSRQEARVALFEAIKTEEDAYGILCESQMEEYEASLGKFTKNDDESKDFANTYEKITAKHQVDSTLLVSLRREAQLKILSIRAAKPDETKVAEDLNGHVLHGVRESYFSNFKWKLGTDYKIKSVQIKEAKAIGDDEYEYHVDILFSSENSDFTGQLRLIYKLVDDWELDMIEPAEIEVVKTGRYDDSVTVEWVREIYGDYIYVTNHTNRTLMVGIKANVWNGEWEKYTITAKGGEIAGESITGLKEYHVEFVERL